MIIRLLILSLLPFITVNVVTIPVTTDYAFPAGTTYWTNPIVINGQVGMTIKGQRGNRGPSRMVYRGPPTLAPFQLIGCTRCQVFDLEIVDESGCDATVLVTNAVNPNSEGFSTGNVFRNVRVLLSGNGKASRRAFSVDSYAAGGADGNNDHHTFDRCYAQSYTEAGFYVKGSQCHDNYYLQCQAHDVGGRRPIGFHAAGAVFFEWHRGAMNSNSRDFLLGTPETQAVINGHNTENATQIVVANFAGQCFFRMTDVRADCRPEAGKPVMDCVGPGPWSIGNSYFAGINGLCPTLRFAGTTPGSLEIKGVMIRQHGGTTPLGPVVACPSAWDALVHGMTHQMITATGQRINKKIYLNVLGVQ